MKVGICTLGCKVNTYESEYIINELQKNNYEIGNFTDICDIYIINTCTVTNASDVKSRKMISQAKRRNPSAIVIALGCYIQAKPSNLPKDIDIILGNKDKSKIVTIIQKYLQDKKTINKVDNLDNKFEDMYIDHFVSRTRAFVKIQDGCENFCSYCIIPYVRGKCRSKDFNTVIKEVNDLVSHGFHEIVLTGIHTGNYGTDINTNLCHLLKELVKIKDLKRLRISSIEVTELNDDILEVISQNDIIVNHLHIPIQAANDKVLKVMNRKYNLEYFKEKIKRIKEIKKDVSITTDIIVGHPYEDDDAFNQSLQEIKDIGFSKLHVFPYSKRKGTKSSAMPQVDDIIKKERTKTLLQLSRQLEINYMNSFLNREVEVLIEKVTDDYSIGHTTNYLQVKINQKLISNQFVKVVIEQIEYPYCIGILIKKID